MAITTDAFGNTFAGNFLAGDTYSSTDILDFLRTALGSNDRANLNANTVDDWRIDWRPNESTTDETLTGVIPSPPGAEIYTTLAPVLAANARFAFSFVSSSGSGQAGVYLMTSGASNVRLYPQDGGGTVCGVFTGGDKYWAVARDSCFALFAQGSSNSFFISQGILENSGLSFPSNRYSIALRNNLYSRVLADGDNNSLVPFFTSTAIANYPHNDGSPTTDEVELYLRRQSDNQHLGYVPNVFKFTVDGTATAPSIGDIVNLDMSAATGFYAGQGITKCIVVGRLGNTSDTDLTGDFLLMKVAS